MSSWFLVSESWVVLVPGFGILDRFGAWFRHKLKWTFLQFSFTERVPFKFYGNGSRRAGTFRLGKLKLFVIRASLLRGTTKDLRVFAFVLHVSTQKTCTDSQSLTLPSRKVPPKMEPVL